MKLSGTHSASLNGPLPIAVSFFWRSAFASPIFVETMPVFGWAMYAMIAAFGFFRLNTTVVGSGAVIVSTSVKNDRATAAVFASRIRSNVYFTSALVSGSPLWNFTPVRSFTVTILPSDDVVGTDSARSG